MGRSRCKIYESETSEYLQNREDESDSDDKLKYLFLQAKSLEVRKLLGR